MATGFRIAVVASSIESSWRGKEKYCVTPFVAPQYIVYYQEVSTFSDEGDQSMG
jgi:hypothetical protein